jgi:hypothetical protein
MLADGFRFYAGALRRFDGDARRQLGDLAAMVMSQIDLHMAT